MEPLVNDPIGIQISPVRENIVYCFKNFSINTMRYNFLRNSSNTVIMENFAESPNILVDEEKY